MNVGEPRVQWNQAEIRSQTLRILHFGVSSLYVALKFLQNDQKHVFIASDFNQSFMMKCYTQYRDPFFSLTGLLHSVQSSSECLHSDLLTPTGL